MTPTSMMRNMILTIDAMGALPFIGYDRMSDAGADVMRDALAKSLSEVEDDVTVHEARGSIKTLEDQLIDASENNIPDKPEGIQRMCAQVALVGYFREEQ